MTPNAAICVVLVLACAAVVYVCTLDAGPLPGAVAAVLFIFLVSRVVRSG